MNGLNNESKSNPENSSRATRRLSNLISAASAFGNLGEEADSQGPSSSPFESSSQSKAIYYSNGAKGLAAASQQQTLLGGKKQQIAQHTEANKAQAHATQEEVHKKMMLVMQNPQLWLQFKSRLAVSDHGGGSVGVQMVLQEFIADHPEIEEQMMQESTKQQLAAASHPKSRRTSILETVSKFSMDLSNEASMRGSITPATFPAEMRRAIQLQDEEDQRRMGSDASPENNDASKSNGFMNSASEIGLKFLRRASAAASSSLSTSTSGFDAEALSSLSSITNTGTERSLPPNFVNGHSSTGSMEYSQTMGTLSSGSGSGGAKPLRARLLVAFNEQEEDGYVSTDGDDEPLTNSMDSIVDAFDELNTSQHSVPKVAR